MGSQLKTKTQNSKKVSSPKKSTIANKKQKINGKGTKLDLPTYQDVVDAAKRLEGITHNTPVMTSRTINEQTGA